MVDMSNSVYTPRFRSTHWSMVARAAGEVGSECTAALEELCQDYWVPVYTFLRRRGLDAAEAEDVTQEFFTELLTNRRRLAAADPAEGRFRTYLLAGVKHRLANHHRRATAVRRGGDATPLSFDWTEAEQKYLAEPTNGWTAEAVFNRRWALTLLDRVLTNLGDYYRDQGRGSWFESLRRFLTTDEKPSYEELAEQLETTPSAVRVAVHRLRKHYRNTLVAEIRATIGGSDDADDERSELLRALAGE